MSPRRRSKGKAHFPPNLYEQRGYYTWRNPITKEPFGFGSSWTKAIRLALECNARIAKQMGDTDIVERATGDGKNTVAAWEMRYSKMLDRHDLTPATRANYLAFSRRIVKMWGGKPMRLLTARNVSDGLESISEEGLPGVAKAVRQYARLSFEEAVNQGWIDANPVRKGRIIGAIAVKRARLTLDVLRRIYETAPTEWLKNAIALALVSAQRREDVARAEFRDFRDGGWWLTQASEKTDHAHRIFVPFELQPTGFPLSLGELLARCRRTGVVSRYLVHQTRQQGRSGLGSAIRLSTVSSAFTQAVDALGADWGDNTPPTFHEIRSLSLRLYGDQGVNVQLLAGHSDPDTTAIYLNSRGHEYARVQVST